MPRFAKQLFYGLFYLALWAGAGYGVWYAVAKPPVPTCFDAIQNQGEEDVDCGGPCAKVCALTPEGIIVHSSESLAADDGYFDVVAILENPNTLAGAESLPYRVSLLDVSDEVIATREGISFLLPGDRRYLIVHGLQPQGGRVPAQALIAVDEEHIQWRELLEYEDHGISVEATTLRFLGGGQPEHAEVTGVVLNRSPFAYDTVEVAVVLFDRTGSIAGARLTEVRTLKSQERRAFRVAWRRPFLKEPVRPDIQVYTNLLANDNYIRRYGRPRPLEEPKQ